ncbi:MAG TPA: zinc ribbon domain-containing protein [Burkholderiaceae bacterium]|nr:zinc ribbon domain-containing protein [Burkholderiaceae bacterium]
MPFYDYECAEHGGFGALRPMAERNAAQPCPRCGLASARVLSEPPMRGLLSSLEREAHAANERSAHEPRSLAAWRSRHGAGCGCCGPGGRARAATRPDGLKGAVGRRPWQISH